MKKMIGLFILVIFLASFTSNCGSENSTTLPTPGAASEITVVFSKPTFPQAPTPYLSGKTIMVNSAADSGTGTLRQAIIEAQRGDLITFDPVDFPPDAPVTIALAESLPEIIQNNVTIDASSAGVILDGSRVTGNGLTIVSNGNSIYGLQISGFSDAGIGLRGGAQFNTIGGDRNVGDGPLGQGNLVGGNGSFGIGLWDEATSYNTIQGNTLGVPLNGSTTRGFSRDGIHSNGAKNNLIKDNVIGGSGTGIYLCCVVDGWNLITDNIIGTDATTTQRTGNQTAGIIVDRSNHNLIGPGNLIVYNEGPGIMFRENTSGNTITENMIRDNGSKPDDSAPTSQAVIPVPVVFDFDINTGSLAGVGCPNCIMEIFSDSADEGGIFEGQTLADEYGSFELDKATAFSGPHLTVTATDSHGTTSGFSEPTNGSHRLLTLQEGLRGSMILFEAKDSPDLEDNRIGSSFTRVGSSEPGVPWNMDNYRANLNTIITSGNKRVDTVYGELEPPIDWSILEYEIPEEFEKFINDLGSSGVAVNYMLHYWDKAGHAMGKELTTPRFQTEDQIQDYLDYVRFIVRHFKGRVQYYTIWSEPDNCNDPPLKCIRVSDYIELARRTIPIIREEDPQAKVVSAPVFLYFARAYLDTLLRSDVISQFDVISWHPFYDAAPDNSFFGNYYYDYPSIVEEIKQLASASGFTGEYWGTELTWRVEGVSRAPEGQPWNGHTEVQSAKYWARGIVMELGMDVGAGLGGPGPDVQTAYQTVRNVNTIMAGAEPADFPVEFTSEINRLKYYWFNLSNGDRLLALWNDAAAVDDDPGVSSIVTIPGFLAAEVWAIDVLNGFEQKLVVTTETGKLIISDLLVKDYPVFLRFKDPASP